MHTYIRTCVCVCVLTYVYIHTHIYLHIQCMSYMHIQYIHVYSAPWTDEATTPATPLPPLPPSLPTSDTTCFPAISSVIVSSLVSFSTHVIFVYECLYGYVCTHRCMYTPTLTLSRPLTHRPRPDSERIYCAPSPRPTPLLHSPVGHVYIHKYTYIHTYIHT